MKKKYGNMKREVKTIAKPTQEEVASRIIADKLKIFEAEKLSKLSKLSN